MSRTYWHGSKGVRAIVVLLYASLTKLAVLSDLCLAKTGQNGKTFKTIQADRIKCIKVCSLDTNDIIFVDEFCKIRAMVLNE